MKLEDLAALAFFFFLHGSSLVERGKGPSPFRCLFCPTCLTDVSVSCAPNAIGLDSDVGSSLSLFFFLPLNDSEHIEFFTGAEKEIWNDISWSSLKWIRTT